MIEWDKNEIRGTFIMPPSTNGLFSGKVRRFKSDAYKSFENYVLAQFSMLNDRPVISGDEWLEVEYTFNFSLYTKKGAKRIKDTANFEKALTDTLCKHIEGFEDHKIYNIIMKKRDSDRNEVDFKIKEV